MTTRIEELQAQVEALESERFTPPASVSTRSEPAWADDFRALLLILSRLLDRPGPPDSTRPQLVDAAVEEIA